MIEINLLPEESRGKKEKNSLRLDLLPYMIVPAISMLILLHAGIFITFFIKAHQMQELDKKWHSLEPDRKTFATLSSEYNIFSQEALAIKDIVSRRVLWAEKLNKLSLDLPSGVWFNDISLSGVNFKLSGSAVSVQNEEIKLINKFLDSLKNDPQFYAGFNDLELGPMQRKALAGYEVVDFTLSGTLNENK
jgi:Tfp pilus assembly protein PilN